MRPRPLDGHNRADGRPLLSLRDVSPLDRRIALAWFRGADVQWEGPAIPFRSSPTAARTHCGGCGSPLSLTYDARDDVAGCPAEKAKYNLQLG